MTHTNLDTTVREQRPGEHEKFQVMGEELVTTVKKLFHEGNVRRILMKHEGQTALEIPLTVGVGGTLLVPWLAALEVMGALLTYCTIEVVHTGSPGEPSLVQG